MTRNIIWLSLTAITFLCIGLFMGGAAVYLLLQNQTPPPVAQNSNPPPAQQPTPTESKLTSPTVTPVPVNIQPETPPSPTPLPVAPVEVTPGTTYEDAVLITAGQYADAVAKGEEDWYKFDILPGHTLNLALQPAGDAKSLEINIIDNASGNSWEFYNIEPPAIATFERTMSGASVGLYYLQIIPYGGGGGRYTLDISWEPQNDANQGGDAGDNADQAFAIPLSIESPTTVTGLVNGFDDIDWYTVDIPHGSILDLTFTPAGEAEEFEVTLYDTNRGEIWNKYNIEPPTTLPLNLVMNSTSGGTYYLAIEEYSNGGGHYTLDLALQTQNDANSGHDAGDEPVQGLEITPSQTYTGLVADFDEFDCYKFTPVTGQIVSFTPGPETNGMGIQLFNTDIKELWRERSVAPTVEKTFQLPEVSGGPYYLCIGNEGEYSLAVRGG